MDIVQDLAVEIISPDTLRALSLPKRMGNSARIAYGGFALGGAISAAHATVQDGHFPYSISAYFLGPATLDERLVFQVERTRTTRTFSTRHITVVQEQNGASRQVMILTVDFQALEEPFLEFSSPPFHKYSHWKNLLGREDQLEKDVQDGKIPRKLANLFQQIFPLMTGTFDIRTCPEATGSQNLLGLNKRVATTQSDLPITDKTNASWVKSTKELKTPAQHTAAAAFFMDGALAFSPLTFSNRFLDDAGAVSSLEASIRFFRPIDFNKWHLQEQRTVVAAHGRTFNIGQLWSDDGNLVAHMSQQCICRAPAPKASKL